MALMVMIAIPVATVAVVIKCKILQTYFLAKTIFSFCFRGIQKLKVYFYYQRLNFVWIKSALVGLGF